MLSTYTQDYVLGYSQPSLRDSIVARLSAVPFVTILAFQPYGLNCLRERKSVPESLP